MKALLLLFSALKLGKVLTTGGTMLISVFAYGLVFGLPYARGPVQESRSSGRQQPTRQSKSKREKK